MLFRRQFDQLYVQQRPLLQIEGFLHQPLKKHVQLSFTALRLSSAQRKLLNRKRRRGCDTLFQHSPRRQLMQRRAQNFMAADHFAERPFQQLRVQASFDHSGPLRAVGKSARRLLHRPEVFLLRRSVKALVRFDVCRVFCCCSSFHCH